MNEQKMISIDKLVTKINRLKQGNENTAPASLALFVKAQSQAQGHELARTLATLEDEMPVFVVQGSVRGEHGWPFQRLVHSLMVLRKNQLIAVKRLILPQDRPILLLAEDFGLFPVGDQLKYVKALHGEYDELGLFPGSILLATACGNEIGEFNPGALSRGFVFSLES